VRDEWGTVFAWSGEGEIPGFFALLRMTSTGDEDEPG
jgi:hypothetical protein